MRRALDGREIVTLGPNSFLRRLPRTLDVAQRLRFEGIVRTADVIEYSDRSVEGLLGKYGREVEAMTAGDRTAIFAHAWSIVDQVYALSQLFSGFHILAQSDEFVAFKSAAQPAVHMRNYMDHLNERLGNIVSTKRGRPPLFGALSYLHCDDQDFVVEEAEKKLKTARSIILFGGQFNMPKNESSFVNPIGRSLRMPVSQVEFRAFDQNINLDAVVSTLASALTKPENHVEVSLKPQLEALAGSTGRSAEEISRPVHSGALFSTLELAFEPPLHGRRALYGLPFFASMKSRSCVTTAAKS
jgi:hypothetical protein